MELKKVSSIELAHAAGVKANAVSYWLTRGSIPFKPTLRRVCQFLGVREEWLVDGVGPREAPKTKSGLDGLPKDLYADLATLGEAAQRSKDVRQVVAHLAHVFRES